MTQSKKTGEYTIVLDELAKGIADDIDNQIIIDLNNTYSATTTYWAGDSITDVTIGGSNDGTFTIDSNTISTVDLDWIYNKQTLSLHEIESMCKEYPALEKVWRNFKSVYDMVKQDYEGKKKAGEIDDDIPF